MSSALTPEMAVALSALAGWRGEREARTDQLGAGLNNLTLRVRYGHEDLVVRQSLPQGPAVKLTWRQEMDFMSAAADAGIAPPLCRIDASVGVSISEYLPAVRSWTRSDLSQPANLERLAAQLTALHAIALELPAYQPVRTVRDYLSHAPAFTSVHGEELVRLADEFERCYSSRVPCHNDLVAGNVLDNGRLWLIDFEYGARSHPLLDLAGAAALNGVAPDGRQRLLRAYYGPHYPDSDEFQRLCRFVVLLSLAWAHALLSSRPDARRRRYIEELTGLLSLFSVPPGVA